MIFKAIIKKRISYIFMNKKIKHALILLFFIFPSGSVIAGSLTAIVPAYFYPTATGSDWDKIGVGLDAGAKIVTIMNPENGPGFVYDPNYGAAVNKLRGKGGKVIGYVPTTFGVRPLSEVKNDIDLYVSRYGIDGIFLDETFNDGTITTLLYYQELYFYIKNLNSNYLVVGNVGTDATSLYLWWPVLDVLITYEGFSWDYYSDPVPSWRTIFTSDHFGMIVHSLVATPSELYLNQITDIARTRNTNYVYVTDKELSSNPFNQLPSFWWEFMYDIIFR
jgi:hypothetical protein